ncbi:MAG: hypothetical protein ABI587_04040 [Gemmatimonadales bacterium]
MRIDSLVQAAPDFAASARGHHGAPQGNLDFLLLAVAIGVVCLVFLLCARYFLHPGEMEPDHIKRRILE